MCLLMCALSPGSIPGTDKLNSHFHPSGVWEAIGMQLGDLYKRLGLKLATIYSSVMLKQYWAAVMSRLSGSKIKTVEIIEIKTAVEET